MNRFFRKRLRDAERDLSYDNVFFRINTESKAKKVVELCAVVPGFIAVIYFIGAWLMLRGVVPAPPGVIAVEVLTGLVASYLTWRLVRAPRVWTAVAALAWLLVEFVRTMASVEPDGPGAEMFVTAFVTLGFAGILGLRGLRKLKHFETLRAAAEPAAPSEGAAAP
ncbi:MAG TPA: hypothetical protein VF079_04705 [Sphingomicrobium sp.]